MNYIDFFGFSLDPFERTAALPLYYESKAHKTALENFRILLSSDEIFASLTGEAGVGKSITTRYFLGGLSDAYLYAYIPYQGLGPLDLLKVIVTEFHGHITENMNREGLYSALKDIFISAKEEGKRVLIVVDDAHNLQRDTAEELETFAEYHKGFAKIALVGQPSLSELPLAYKVVLHYNLSNLDNASLVQYVQHRIKNSGKGGKLRAPKGVLKVVWRVTKGNPRLVNIVLEKMAVAAFLAKSYTLKREHLNSALQSMNNLYGLPLSVAGAGLIQYTLAFTALIVVTFAVISKIVRYEPTAEAVTAPVSPPAPAVRITEETQRTVLEPLPVETKPLKMWAAVKVPTLNVRAEPDRVAPILGLVYSGQLIEVLEENEEWIRVDAGGEAGWIFKQHLQFEYR